MLANMIKLLADHSAMRMHGIGDTPPALDLAFGVDAWGADVALALLADLAGLSDDQK
mgnify:CR=1 FL=1